MNVHGILKYSVSYSGGVLRSLNPVNDTKTFWCEAATNVYTHTLDSPSKLENSGARNVPFCGPSLLTNVLSHPIQMHSMNRSNRRINENTTLEPVTHREILFREIEINGPKLE